MHVSNFMKNKTTSERFSRGKKVGGTFSSSFLSVGEDGAADFKQSLTQYGRLSEKKKDPSCTQNCRDMCMFRPRTQEEIFDDYEIRISRYTIHRKV